MKTFFLLKFLQRTEKQTMNKPSITYFLSLFFILIIFNSTTQAQEKNTPAIYPNNHATEEVYLQTDKNIYETGENLWFKGYVLNAQTFSPSLKSKTLYVSMLQLPDKKMVWQEKYTVTSGFTNGHIYVNDTLQPGEYIIVAQTGYSVNHEEPLITSTRRIEVIKDISTLEARNKSSATTIKPTEIDFQLLPEGGHLVAGITSKVAFKAVDRNGNPVDIKGTIYNGSERILTVESRHAGMGSFFITPETTGNYYVKLEGYPQQYPLPEIQHEGYIMQMLYNKGDVLTFKVSQSAALLEGQMQVALQMQGVVYNTATFTLKNEKLIKLETGELPTGIAEVTLYNHNLQPVAERLVFVNDHKQLNITISPDKTIYKTKEKVTLKITTKDGNGKPISGHLGISVSDVIYNDTRYTGTLQSYCLISAQLKGRIYDPGYYFNQKNKNRLQALDLLLLTQGWRSYAWNNEILKNQSEKLKPFVSDTITGSIYAKKKKAETVLEKQYIMSYSVDVESENVLIPVNSKGEYTILPEDMQRYKRGHLYFKLFYGKDLLGIKKLYDPAIEKITQLITSRDITFSLPNIPKQKPTPIPEKRLKVAANVNRLKEVVITSRVKKKRRFGDKYMGQLDSIVNSTDYVCMLNVLNCRNHPINGRRPVEGEIYKSPDTDLPMPSYKFKNYTEDELMELFNITRIKCYYPTKEFYSPVYDIEMQYNEADFRNTLFWKPDVVTNENGTAEIEFYTSDVNSVFRINAEGISSNGLLGGNANEFKVDSKE